MRDLTIIIATVVLAGCGDGGPAATPARSPAGAGAQAVSGQRPAASDQRPAAGASADGWAAYGPWHSCRIGGGGNMTGVELCPSDPQRLYANVDIGGVYRSDDGGSHWRMLHGALPAKEGAYMVRGVSVDPRDADRILVLSGGEWTRGPGDIFRSDDGGATFTATAQVVVAGANADCGTGRILVRQPGAPDTVLAGSLGDGVRRSTDGGLTWSDCGVRGVNVVAIVHDARDPSAVWLCGRAGKRRVHGSETGLDGGLWRSRDGGATWERIADEAPSELVQTPADPARCYGLWRGRPARSDDDGRTWQSCDDGIPPRDGSHWMVGACGALAATPDAVVCGTSDGRLFRLVPPATAWSEIPRAAITAVCDGRPWYKRGEIGKALNGIVVDPRDPAHWWLSDWYALYRSPDAGRTWVLAIDGLEITAVHCFEQDPSDPAVVHLGMADNGYFRSVDGGTRFAQVDWHHGIGNNIKCISVSPDDPALVYAVGPRTYKWEANQVSVSHDRGVEWQRSPMRGLPDMDQHHCNSIVVVPGHPDEVLLALSGRPSAGGGVWRSQDGGQSWQPDSAGLPDEELFQHGIWHYGREITVDPAGNAVCSSSRLGQVFIRPAGATTWTPGGAVAGRPNALAAGAPGCFLLAAQTGGLWRTGDAGRTWQQVLERTAFHVAVDRVHPQRILASIPGQGVVFSRDGGLTWIDLDAALPYRLTFAYVGFAGDRALVGSDGSGAFWMRLP